jgi:hypothetical protein
MAGALKDCRVGGSVYKMGTEVNLTGSVVPSFV